MSFTPTNVTILSAPNALAATAEKSLGKGLAKALSACKAPVLTPSNFIYMSLYSCLLSALKTIFASNSLRDPV